MSVIVGAYRRHIELTDDELDRLEAVMAIRPLYLACLVYRRNLVRGSNEDVSRYGDPDYLRFTAEAARAALRK